MDHYPKIDYYDFKKDDALSILWADYLQFFSKALIFQSLV